MMVLVANNALELKLTQAVYRNERLFTSFLLLMKSAEDTGRIPWLTDRLWELATKQVRFSEVGEE